MFPNGLRKPKRSWGFRKLKTLIAGLLYYEAEKLENNQKINEAVIAFRLSEKEIVSGST